MIRIHVLFNAVTSLASRSRSRVLLFALVLAVTVPACRDGGAEDGAQARPGGPGGGPDAGRPIPVAARTAAPAELRVMLRGTAHLQAREQVDVLPKQGGVVARVLVEEGARVAVGTPLAVLDDQEWRLQAQQSDARARAASDAATRAVALQQQGLLAEQEVERLRSEAQVAVADRALARLRVENATIRSPIAGVVTHRYVERGQMVGTTAAAFAVADVARLEAVVGVPEREAVRVTAGQAAMIRVEGLPQPVQGRVSRVRPVVDPQSGTVQVTIEVDPAQGGGLRAGQFVNVDIVTETLAERITLPRTAVLVDGVAPRVFLVQEGRALEREVQLGISQGDQVEIRSGLAAGDTVVVVGQDNLRPGAVVRLMEVDGVAVAQQPPAAPPAASGERREQAGERRGPPAREGQPRRPSQ
jgi:RND family efflux transporter MFP subunit